MHVSHADDEIFSTPLVTEAVSISQVAIVQFGCFFHCRMLGDAGGWQSWGVAEILPDGGTPVAKAADKKLKSGI